MKTREEAYEAWAKNDPSRKGVQQLEAFMAGWKQATDNAADIVRSSYILDESEDFKKVAIENVKRSNGAFATTQEFDDWYYYHHFRSAQ